MSDFKYEVGDTFDLGTRLTINTREIVARFKALDGENRYVIRHFVDGGPDEDCEDDIQGEQYIDEMYTRIEPFFEVGKRYTRNGFETECIEIYKRKHKYALMLFNDNSLALRDESDFAAYREV